MVSCFPNLKLRQTDWFVGLHAKEFKIKRAWKCYDMYSETVLFQFERLVIVCTLISQQQENFITCETNCTKRNDFLEGRIEYFIDLACFCKNHLASKLLKSSFKSKKKQMLYCRYCWKPPHCTADTVEKKHAKQIRQKQRQRRWIYNICFQLQLKKRESSQK